MTIQGESKHLKLVLLYMELDVKPLFTFRTFKKVHSSKTKLSILNQWNKAWHLDIHWLWKKIKN